MGYQPISKLVIGIAGFFIFLFVYTGVSKFMEFEVFKSVLSRSPLIGDNASLVAIALPVAEFLVASLLIFERSRLVALYATLLLMVVFTGYIAYMLLFANDLPCSCGGVLQSMTWKTHLLFNIFLTGLAFSGVILNRRLVSYANTDSEPDKNFKENKIIAQ